MNKPKKNDDSQQEPRCLTPYKIDPKAEYNSTQAALALGKSRSTIYLWDKLGYIKRIKGTDRYLGSVLLKGKDRRDAAVHKFSQRQSENVRRRLSS